MKLPMINASLMAFMVMTVQAIEHSSEQLGADLPVEADSSVPLTRAPEPILPTTSSNLLNQTNVLPRKKSTRKILKELGKRGFNKALLFAEDMIA